MKQDNSLPFINQKIRSLLKRGTPFFLKGFDFRLLPLFFSSFNKKGLFFYDLPAELVYNGLMLSIKGRGAYFNKEFFLKGSSLEGFAGFFDERRDVFFASLLNRFQNHSFVLFPFELKNSAVFKKVETVEGFLLDRETSYSSLLEKLSFFGYSSVDFVSERGNFSARGMVIDFFPFDYNFGVRVLFDSSCVEIFSFNVETQLVIKKIDKFLFSKTRDVSVPVKLGEFIDPSLFYEVYISKEGVSFFKKTPSLSISLSVSPLPLNHVLINDSVSFFNPPCMVGYSFKNEVYSPSWLKRRPPLPGLSGDVYVDFSSLGRGDFVVHEDFGIGQYLGLSESREGESMLIKYRDSKINVFPSYFSKVSFYKKRGSGVGVDALGKGSSWKRRVSAVKKATSLVAGDLVSSFSQRKNIVSDVFFLDKDLEQELLEGFDFKETEDQGVAWKEIKKDLLSKTPMDRLLCGDVGFGKTELAIRACFVAAINGKRAIVLAPTTILAKQLFLSFVRRLSPYNIVVKHVSRFVKNSLQKEAISSFLNKGADVLIGTHKVLFNRLCLEKTSLMIVDDEHRFGVKQKESVKKHNPRVNMLYMSATPIPRTLKMALSSIKSISTLSSPPAFKLPSTTYVDSFSIDLIKRAVLFEVARGGQVFFIHNKVQTMPSVVSFLKKHLSGFYIEFLHGQEPAEIVNKKITSFIDKKIDVLVASSIVESGVDISSVNTIIINNSHLFGVSQLYQLRGRVGRGSVPSFAYFLVPKNISLSSVAKRRLKIIEKNSSLGSCYAVSLEDMRLRGGGSVFGYQQSGSLGSIGFELYNRLLEGAVESKMGRALEKTSCIASSSVRAYIPKEYLPSIKMRVWLYKELSSLQSLSSFSGFIKKIVDLFGPIPLFLKNLVELRYLEVMGGQCFFSNVFWEEGFLKITFFPFFWRNKIDALFSALIGYKFVLLEGGKVLRVELKKTPPKEVLDIVYRGVIKNDK